MEEKWQTFKTTDWKGLGQAVTEYQVSNLGNLRKISDNRGKITIKEMQPALSGGNPGSRYYCIGDNRFKYVHRLVAEHFIPNPEGLPVVDHIDGDKLNNSVDNLRWCTQKDNVKWYFESIK